jgi:hypothetical protein
MQRTGENRRRVGREAEGDPLATSHASDFKQAHSNPFQAYVLIASLRIRSRQSDPQNNLKTSPALQNPRNATSPSRCPSSQMLRSHCRFRRIGFLTLQDLNRHMRCAHRYETLFRCYYCKLRVIIRTRRISYAIQMPFPIVLVELRQSIKGGRKM